ADSAGGPVWLATSGFEPRASLTVFTMIEPLIVPLAVGVSATESTVWPALAGLKAPLTRPPRGVPVGPDSDTGKPKTQAAEAGLAVSVGAQAQEVTVAVAKMVPVTGVVLGWVTTTAPVAGRGVGTVIAPCSAGGTSVFVATPVHSGLGVTPTAGATPVQYADGGELRGLMAGTPPTVAVHPRTPAAAFGGPVMGAPPPAP